MTPMRPVHQSCAASPASTSSRSSCSVVVYSSSSTPGGRARPAQVEAHAGEALGGDRRVRVLVEPAEVVVLAIGHGVDDGGPGPVGLRVGQPDGGGQDGAVADLQRQVGDAADGMGHGARCYLPPRALHPEGAGSAAAVPGGRARPRPPQPRPQAQRARRRRPSSPTRSARRPATASATTRRSRRAQRAGAGRRAARRAGRAAPGGSGAAVRRRQPLRPRQRPHRRAGPGRRRARRIEPAAVEATAPADAVSWRSSTRRRCRSR